MGNIFLKTCPECAQAVSVGAEVCSCGYVFESGQIGETLTAEARTRQEELYQEYLRARAEQAAEAARVASEAAELDPQDPQKANAAAKEQRAAAQAEAELAAQAARIAAMKRLSERDFDLPVQGVA